MAIFSERRLHRTILIKPPLKPRYIRGPFAEKTDTFVSEREVEALKKIE